jgi:hypothetical protein
MPLTRTIDQMVDATRRCTDTQGTAALVRHPDVDLFDYVNRGIAALARVLRSVDSGQRFLSSTTITTVAGTELYTLPPDFMFLVSLGGEVNSVQRWLTSYEMNERPHLVDDNAGWTGEPMFYRLRGDNISLVPVPAAVYSLTLWYTANPSTLSTGQTFDTIARLDDYVVWWAAKEIAKKDRNWELHDRLGADLAALRADIESIGASRDKNSAARIIDVTQRDRYGRFNRYGGR